MKSKKVVDVTVIIPFFNGSWCIERSLKSALSQTFQPKEIIVVNDGSSPGESNFLKKINLKYKFKLLNKVNGGQGSARNLGVQASKSKYICFLDQDDTFYKKHIEYLLTGIPADDDMFGFIYGDVDISDRNGSYEQKAIVKTKCQHPKRSVYEMISTDMHILPSASLILRHAFNSVGGFDEQFTGYEDDDLFLRLFMKGYTNYFLDKSVVLWHINSDSTSFSIKMARSRMRYFLKLKSSFPDLPEQNKFPFRDFIFPRFRNAIFFDTYFAIKLKREPADEYLELCNQFILEACKNPYLSLRSKFKLTLVLFGLKYKFCRNFIFALLPIRFLKNFL
jgi:glycosyltransferase involved in cell wall biosynthesis